ncbi:inactive protein kinase SELMODRAFT_444075-like isoform X2 [Musa acuminata AAA Group]|uniref:inactive protein kinase SELMODRAFT_444075-like isoform X2 n=1 Tax=Musa acuminata AAA Group TaxID=214697 RepID=UPI0031D5453C
MGCFTVLKCKKKKIGCFGNKKRMIAAETVTCALPEPTQSGPSLQSAPPSFRNRTKPAQSGHRILNSRVRALSAPSTLVLADQYALASLEYDDQEECKGRGISVKDQRFSNPLPLPLPSPHTFSLRNLESFNLNNTSDPIVSSGPLPLPPLGGGGLRNFSYEEISAACQNFSVGRCMSEGLSTTIYKATFGDDSMSLKRSEATVTRLLPSCQAMYYEFSTSNIQVDKDFSAKLSGYGCASYNPDADVSDSSIATANLSAETLEQGLFTPKSNVWSFGIVLLELLTGRKNLDNRCPKEERNIVKWSRPFLADDCRLSLIMDPRMKGRFPPKSARTVADVALKCLRKDPSKRPTMRFIVEALKDVPDMKCPSRYPLQEPSVIAGKRMCKSPSLTGIIPPQPPPSFSISPPSKSQLLLSPRTSIPIPYPPLKCTTTRAVEDNRISSIRSCSPAMQRLEGF